MMWRNGCYVVLLWMMAACAFGESLWDDSVVPAILADSDTAAVELGVKFSASVEGDITGIRFYKGVENTGVHVGSLWDANGQLLAQAAFTDETASGWQQVDFAEAVPVSADTVYVASYHTEVGRYAADNDYFTGDYSNGSYLLAPASDAVGGNGVYQYGSGGYPSSSYADSNYWVDVVFDTDYTPPPPVGSVSLQWDGVDGPEVGGYRMYYGTQPGGYSNNVDVGNVTQAQIGGLTYDTTYYFAVTAYPAPEYTMDFSESGFSNEVEFLMGALYLAPPQNIHFVLP